MLRTFKSEGWSQKAVASEAQTVHLCLRPFFPKMIDSRYPSVGHALNLQLLRKMRWCSQNSLGFINGVYMESIVQLSKQ